MPTPPQPVPRKLATRLALADDMRGCVVDQQLVLLDLQRSRYLGASGSPGQAWQRALCERTPRLPSPQASFDIADDASGPGIGMRQLLAFLAATARAAWWLRFRSLRDISDAIRSRQRRCDDRDPATRAARLHTAVAVFDRLRPLVLTARDQCLFDSLALVLFLAGQGVAARWVIGVATQPFRAHAWVQDGDLVLNDLHDKVSRYTPIHAV